MAQSIKTKILTILEVQKKKFTYKLTTDNSTTGNRQIIINNIELPVYYGAIHL